MGPVPHSLIRNARSGHIGVPVVAGLAAVLVLSVAGLGELTWTEAAWIVVAALSLVAVALAVPWGRLPGWARLSMPVASIALIAITRHLAGGPKSGLSFLLLLPVIWVSLDAGAWQAVVVVVAAVAALLLPIPLSGAYSTSESIRALAFAVVAAVVALLLQRARSTALTDALTGIGNRRAWDDALGRQVQEAARTGRPAAIALLDLDRFKAFNDAHGHGEGDALLREAAAAWARTLRRYDVLCRVGGEEFGVIFPGASEGEAMAAVDRLRRSTPRGETCSVGVSLLTPLDSPVDVMARADDALYRAKAAGRNRCVLAPSPGISTNI